MNFPCAVSFFALGTGRGLLDQLVVTTPLGHAVSQARQSRHRSSVLHLRRRLDDPSARPRITGAAARAVALVPFSCTWGSREAQAAVTHESAACTSAGPARSPAAAPAPRPARCPRGRGRFQDGERSAAGTAHVGSTPPGQGGSRFSGSNACSLSAQSFAAGRPLSRARTRDLPRVRDRDRPADALGRPERPSTLASPTRATRDDAERGVGHPVDELGNRTNSSIRAGGTLGGGGSLCSTTAPPVFASSAQRARTTSRAPTPAAGLPGTSRTARPPVTAVTRASFGRSDPCGR